MTISDVTRSRLLLAGAAIILLGLTLRWYTASVADIGVPDGTRSGWSALGRLDVYLVLLVAACVAAAPLSARRPAVTGTMRLGITIGATLGLALVIYRIVSPPDSLVSGFVTDASPSIGPFVTLVGVVLVLAVARPSDAMPVRA